MLWAEDVNTRGKRCAVCPSAKSDHDDANGRLRLTFHKAISLDSDPTFLGVAQGGSMNPPSYLVLDKDTYYTRSEGHSPLVRLHSGSLRVSRFDRISANLKSFIPP